MKNRKVSIKLSRPNPVNPTNRIDADMNSEIYVNPAIFHSINGLLKSSCEIIHFVKLQFQIFHQKLTNISKLLKKYFESNIMKIIKQKIFVFKTKIANELKQENGLLDLTIIMKMQNDLHKTINDEKVELKHQDNQKSDPNLNEKIQNLEYAVDLLVLGNEMNYEFYENEAIVRACAVALNRIPNNKKQLEITKNNLGSVLIQKVYDIRKSIITMSQNLPSKQYIELDMSN